MKTTILRPSKPFPIKKLLKKGYVTADEAACPYILDCIADGMKITELVAWLNRDGITNPQGKPWATGSIRSALQRLDLFDAWRDARFARSAGLEPLPAE